LSRRNLDNLDKESDVRIVKLVPTSFSSLSLNKHWKRNLLKFPYHIDVINCMYLEMPLDELKDVNDIEEWLLEITFNWGDGFFYVLGRTKEFGRINNLYQIPIVRFKLRDGNIKVDWKDIRKKGGTSQLSRPYWLMKHLKDLKKHKDEDDYERYKV